RARWAAHNVRQHFTGTKRVRHPAVGDIELTYEVFDVSTDGDLRLVVYTAQPGSTSEDALKLLASWTATEAQKGEDLSTRP
ncbi:MAG TPA: transcriptional regulator, partial [Acidimicrobiales bacterium]|nr:transcriptional regulator [Acidimicrobiales bacterium]